MAEKLQSAGLMRRRTYLRTVTMAVPGLLLTGWAPVRAAARTVQLRLLDVAVGSDAEALRAGVELGVDDAHHAARVLEVPLFVHRGGEAGALPCGDKAVQIVVADHDDEYLAAGAAPCAPRVYTCPLRQWRPEAWSVASRPSSSSGQTQLDWHPTLDTPAAAQLGVRFTRRFGAPMGEAAWRGWMAVKAAFEIALRAEAGEDDPLVLRLDGHKGDLLRFSEDGHLVQPTCRVVAGRASFAPPVDREHLFDAD